MDVDYTNHARRHMRARGVTEEEVADVIRTGSVAPGRLGRLITTKVLTTGYHWQGSDYPHKEVQVIHTQGQPQITVITVKSRYGFWAGVE